MVLDHAASLDLYAEMETPAPVGNRCGRKYLCSRRSQSSPSTARFAFAFIALGACIYLCIIC